MGQLNFCGNQLLSLIWFCAHLSGYLLFIFVKYLSGIHALKILPIVHMYLQYFPATCYFQNIAPHFFSLNTICLLSAHSTASVLPNNLLTFLFIKFKLSLCANMQIVCAKNITDLLVHISTILGNTHLNWSVFINHSFIYTVWYFIRNHLVTTRNHQLGFKKQNIMQIIYWISWVHR